MREKEDEWLGDVDPKISALERFLSRENNGIKVYEFKSYYSTEKKIEIHEMSNGSSYALDENKRWCMV